MPTAQAQLDGLFARYEPPLAKLGKALRKKLRARLPGLFEVVYLYENQGSLVLSYSPTEHGHEAVCSLALRANEVRLYFAGGPRLSQADPSKLLRGSGKSVRYVPLETAASLDREEIETLIAAALEFAQVHPEPSAEGAVIFKVAEQKQRAQRTERARAAKKAARAKKANRTTTPGRSKKSSR